MYPNLKAEMARRGITTTQLAEALGLTLATMSHKMNGLSEFTLTEIFAVKDFLGVNMALDVLFKRAAA